MLTTFPVVQFETFDAECFNSAISEWRLLLRLTVSKGV